MAIGQVIKTFLMVLIFASCSGGSSKVEDRSDNSSDNTDDTASSVKVGSLVGGFYDGTILSTGNAVVPDYTSDHGFSSGAFDLTHIVAIWSMDEIPDKEDPILDGSGNGVSGVFKSVSGGSHASTGVIRGSVNFTHTDQDFVLFPQNNQLDNLSEISISAWIKPEGEGLGGAGAIISKCDSTLDCGVNNGIDGSGWFFGFDDSGDYNLIFNLKTTTGYVSANIGNNAVMPNQWNHVVVTWNGAISANGNIRIYVNGIEHANQNLIDGSGAREDDSLAVLRIGASPNNLGYFDGHIDEIALWERVLSTEEIQEVFEKQSRVYRGEFISSVFDSEAKNTNWESLVVTTDRPVMKPIPLLSESVYEKGNFDASNLVAYFPMDGTEGASVSTDAGGVISQGPNKITATAFDTNASLNFVEGRIGQAMSFDGSEDHVVLENSSSLDVTGKEISLMAWVKVAKACCSINGGRIISKKNDGNGNDVYALFVLGSNRVPRFRVAGMDIISTENLVQDKWYFLAGVYDGNEMKIYLNGKSVATAVSNTNNIESSSNSVHIGMRENESRYFQGAIDDAMIFSRALSATEINDIYLRARNTLLYQVRSCNESQCSGENFVGPDNTSGTYFSESNNLLKERSVFDLTSVPSGRFIQFRALFESVDPDTAPKIKSLELEGRKAF